MTGQPPLGYKLLSGLFLGIALWGRFPWWGGHRPLGTRIPHNDSLEGRGGPWAPPPRVFFSKLCCSLLVSRPLSVLGVRFHDVDGLFWAFFLAFLFGVGQMSCLSLFCFFCLFLSLSLSPFLSLFLSFSLSLFFFFSLSLVHSLKRQRSG